MDAQGGKKFGLLKKQQEADLDELNQKILDGIDYKDVENLEEKLEVYKKQFIDFDEDHSGDIDMMELKRMMEKMGQPKTHLELKKMIAEVDSHNSGTIHYDDFLNMMLGSKSSVLKLILMFESKKKEKEVPKGLPPKKSLADLP
eukprot:m.6731 g.6731  ORF g.6731 m.6731 type:complete len:144 (-) comp2645_c0_seq1:82-513(-)